MSFRRLIDGSEIAVTGPLALSAAEPGTLMWLAKAGGCVAGSVRLACDLHHHVATLKDLQLGGNKDQSRQAVSSKLLAAVAEYVREHGILKVKVHRNSRLDWIPQQLSRHGLSDATTRPDHMQFYVDLYRPVKKLHHLHRVNEHAPEETKLAS